MIPLFLKGKPNGTTLNAVRAASGNGVPSCICFRAIGRFFIFKSTNPFLPICKGLLLA